MSNFPSSPTRNITSHSKENLAFHSLLRWKMILIQILTTLLMHFLFRKVGRMYFLSSGVKWLMVVVVCGMDRLVHWSQERVIPQSVKFILEMLQHSNLFFPIGSQWPLQRNSRKTMMTVPSVGTHFSQPENCLVGTCSMGTLQCLQHPKYPGFQLSRLPLNNIAANTANIHPVKQRYVWCAVVGIHVLYAFWLWFYSSRPNLTYLCDTSFHSCPKFEFHRWITMENNIILIINY